MGTCGVTPAGPLLNLPSKPLCHFLPIYSKFYPLLESFSTHLTDKEKHGTEKPHLQPKVTHISKEQAWKHSFAPGSLKTDPILPSKDHREPSTEAMASEAREGTANWAEQCVTCNAQLKQMPRSLL